MIEEAITTKAAELESQLATSAEQIVDAEHIRDSALADKLAAELERDRLKDERDHAVAEARRDKTQLETSQGQHREESASLLERVADVEGRLQQTEDDAEDADEKRRRLRRNVAAVAGCGVVDIAGGSLILTSTVSGLGGDAATVSVMALAIYGAIRVISKHLAKEVTAVIGIVSLVVAVVSLIAASH
jgi:hypothetical protein